MQNPAPSAAQHAPDTPQQGPVRLPLVDGIRGYLIVAMTVGHFIAITGWTGLNFLTHKPFAVFLTGEGFMAVSGFMCGYILTHGLPRRGARGSALWGLRRSLKIVLHYVVVFALCALPALLLPLSGSFASVLFHGREAFGAGDVALLLSGLYRPGFFDILYLYVVYIALAPLVVLLFQSRLRMGVVALCLLAWLLTQYGFTQRAFEALFARLPAARIEEAGSFHIFAWQLLFFGGLALGALFARDPSLLRRWAGALPRQAFALVLTVLVVFAVVGLMSASGVASLGLRYLRDYQIVAPLPLLNFVLACLALAHVLTAPGFADSRLRRIIEAVLMLRPLRDIGKVTLQSFSASIVLSYWVAYLVPAGQPTGAGFALGSFALCMAGVWLVSRVVIARQKARRGT